jgi:hypothetical protein
MSNPETGYSQADLRFFLPIEAGQRVGVLGESQPLVEALAADGVGVILLSTADENMPKSGDFGLRIGQRSPTSPDVGAEVPPDLDHLILLECASDRGGTRLFPLLKRLKPGGRLLLGIYNSDAIYFLFSKKRPPGKSFLSLRKVRDLLDRAGLRLVSCYGAKGGLESPEILVPLDTGATSFYFRNIYIPAKQVGAWEQVMAASFASFGLQRWFFRGLVVIAGRPNGGNSD